MTDAAILEQAAAWLAEGRPAALATVLRTWGSSPRPEGSQLAATADGAFVGSVSGGCVEAAVVEEAAAVLAGAPPRHLQYGVSDERAWSLGLACGGRIAVRVERADAALLRPLLEDLAARRPVVVVTPLPGGPPRLVHPGEAPGELDALVRRAVARDGSGQLDGPDGRLFLRAYAPPVRLVIVGAVHIAQALAPMAQLAGYDVVVADPRQGFATPERLPGAALLGEWPDAALRRLRPDARTAVVALSHDPKLDDPALFEALSSEAFYVGALGSRGSHAARLDRLRAEGVGEAALSRIRGPVGLDLGAVSPGEIAAAILAELVLHLRRPEAAGAPPFRGG